VQDLHSNCVLVYAFMHFGGVFSTAHRDFAGKQTEWLKNLYVLTDLTCSVTCTGNIASYGRIIVKAELKRTRKELSVTYLKHFSISA
jgi:hypothetical protein